MEKNIEVKAGGLKCDNPNCNYRDDYVKVEDYENWINKPCPLCGEVLLTQKDYDSTKLLLGLVNFVNGLKLPDWMKKEPKVNLTVKTNGSGGVELEVSENLESETRQIN